MALSMDEQRMLAEIERRLAAEDPGLAACLTSFRRPGPATVLRSPRARIVGSLFTVLLVAMVSLMVYAMIPFRTHNLRTPDTTTTTFASSRSTLSATTTGGRSHGTQQAPASASPDIGAAASSPGKSATSTGKAQAASAKAPTRSVSQSP